MGTHALHPPLQEAAGSTCYRLQVSAVIEETTDARSLVFEVPPALRERFAYRAGQFLGFRVPIAEQWLTRCYSMASAPQWDSQLRVTVKRVEGGRVSQWMNQQVQVGDWLQVLPPAGRFCLSGPAALDDPRPLVLFGGGSGITPVFSILKSVLLGGSRPVTLVYANRDEASVIFKEELQQLARTHGERLEIIHLLDSVQGYLSQAQVRHLLRLRHGGEYFICGPGPFMDTVENTLLALGEAREDIHVERFVSPPDPQSQTPPPGAVEPSAATAQDTTLIVELDGQAHQVPCQPGQTLLQSCRAAGLQVPASCEEGFCGACMCQLKEGQALLARNDVLSPGELDAGWTLACQGRPSGARVHVRFPD